MCTPEHELDTEWAWSSSSLFRTLVLNLARSGKQQCLPSSKIIWSNSSGTPSTGRGPVQQVHSSPWPQPTSQAYSSPHCKSEQLRSRGSSWQMLIRTPKFLKTLGVASTRKHWHSRQMHFFPALCGQGATNRIPFPTLQRTMKRSMHHRIKWRAFELAGDWLNILSLQERRVQTQYQMCLWLPKLGGGWSNCKVLPEKDDATGNSVSLEYEMLYNSK